MTETEASPVDYHDWNRRLVEHFFHSGRRHQRVRLAIDEETLAELGGSAASLAASAVSETSRRGLQNLQDLALSLHAEWDAAKNEGNRPPPAPPFLAILVLYVLAVDHGGGRFPAHAYYDRLNDLLASPATEIRSIEASLNLWHAVEDWSARQMGGRYGYFEASARGNQAYVGIPRRQALLAPREERPLGLAFQSAGLLPGSNPTDMRLVLATKNADGLLTRTKRLLRSWPSDAVSHELLGEIRASLDNWHVVEGQMGAARGPSLRLRLVLRAQRGVLVAGRLETELVAGRTDRDRRMELIVGAEDIGSRTLWLHSGDDSGLPIVVDEDGDPTWHQPDWWFTALSFEVEEAGIRLERQARPYLLLRRRNDGLLEECEEDDLSPEVTCLVVAPSERRPELPSRYERVQEDWQLAPELPGLVHRAVRLGSLEARGHIQVPRARLVGGIRSESGGRAWLPFAPPQVLLSGLHEAARGDVVLRCLSGSGRELSVRRLAVSGMQKTGRDELGFEGSEPEATLRIPALSAKVEICELDVTIDGSLIAELRCYFEQNADLAEYPTPRGRDSLGEPTQETASGRICGVDVIVGSEQRVGPIRSRAKKPKQVSTPTGDSAGMLVMRLLRSRGRVSWQQAKRWLPRCLGDDERSGHETAYLVNQVASLHALGVLEMEEDLRGGLARLVALPPAISLLPRLANRGMTHGSVRFSHEALLLGCWLPEELEQLHRAARRAGLELVEMARETGLPLAPHRRSLLIDGDLVLERLRRAADEAGVKFLGETPLACRLVDATSAISGLASAPGWLPGKPASSYTKRFFDPRALGVVRDEREIGDRYVLWECREREWWHHYVVDREANRHLRVHDRQLGRWFVRREALPETPVPVFDDVLFLPFELRLPRVLERALVLSSGFAPRLKCFQRVESPFTFASTSTRFSIPAPPDRPIDWLAARVRCTGNFCCYEGVFDTDAWPRSDSMPMLTCNAEQVSGLGLER